MTIDSQTSIDLLKMMLRIRAFELRVALMFKEHRMFAGPHLYEGEEAIATGVCAHLRADDYVTSTHRGHGHCVAKGVDLSALLAELCGKATGCCGGKGGTMHIFDPSVGLMGTNGIVGGGIPLAVGLGLSAQLKKTDQVAVSFFGDGASNNGSFHESLNMAAMWKLPVLFVCENNQYATSVNVRRSTSVADISIRAVGYGIPGITVDGNKVDEVYATAGEAVARARAGEGPTLIECKTYRVRGHFEGDDCHYRTSEEVDAARLRDPIEYWKRILKEHGDLSDTLFDSLTAEVDNAIEEATVFAESSPWPAPEDALIIGQ
jgi:TPP-dependent pyruvate/acetoin dehydrogenase alpha subunit